MEKKKKKTHARVGEGEGNPGKNWIIFFANYTVAIIPVPINSKVQLLQEEVQKYKYNKEVLLYK